MFTYSVGTSRRSRPSASQKAQRKVDLALGFEPHLVHGREKNIFVNKKKSYNIMFLYVVI